jgi:hypothetical protein
MENPIMEISGLRAEVTKREHRSISKRIEDTFGPNPCNQLKLTHEDGTTIELICNGKRCIHCGPRKKMMIELQMRALGTYAYISRFDNRKELDRCIERTRKSSARAGIELLLQSVGDETLGYIVVCNRPLHTNQRMQRLSDWTKRILDTYHHAVQRIRRSHALGRVSLVRIRKDTKSGHPSMWSYKSTNTRIFDRMKDASWAEIIAEIEGEHDEWLQSMLT